MADSFVAAAIYKWAEDHYTEGGWDVIVECWTLPMIDEYIVEAGATNFKDGLKAISGLASIWADQQADAINSAF